MTIFPFLKSFLGTVNVKFARPPGGISQNLFKKYKEKKLRKNLKAETILKKDHFY